MRFTTLLMLGAFLFSSFVPPYAQAKSFSRTESYHLRNPTPSPVSPIFVGAILAEKLVQNGPEWYLQLARNGGIRVGESELLFAQPLLEQKSGNYFVLGSIQLKNYRRHFASLLTADKKLLRIVENERELRKVLLGKEFTVRDGWKLKDINSGGDLWPSFAIQPRLDGNRAVFEIRKVIQKITSPIQFNPLSLLRFKINPKLGTVISQLLVALALGAVWTIVLHLSGNHSQWSETLPLLSVLSAGENPLFRTQSKRNAGILSQLGLSYPEFQKLAQAQADYEENLKLREPTVLKFIFSTKTHQRFSKTLLELAPKLRNLGVIQPLTQALLFAKDHYYGDISGTASQDPSILNKLLGIGISLDDPIDRMVARALITNDPILFNLGRGSDPLLVKSLKKITEALGVEISTLWSHPFMDEEQLIAQEIPEEKRVVAAVGLGELARTIFKAKEEFALATRAGRAPKKFILLIKNIESMDPRVRAVFQKMFITGELSHSNLATLQIPENFQILFTKAASSDLTDIYARSFYDQLVVKTVPEVKDFLPPVLEGLPPGIREIGYLPHLRIER
ncbi:MAG: hypothetical protein HYY63_05280, partial [Elusimicrobia bacterium]|nr:hypothetical protein [Elusimicrobiota bacterium]